MTKWEYHTETIHMGQPVSYKPIEVRFAALGEEGWECYEVNEGTAYFRRQKQHPIPVTLGATEHKEVSNGPGF